MRLHIEMDIGDGSEYPNAANTKVSISDDYLTKGKQLTIPCMQELLLCISADSVIPSFHVQHGITGNPFEKGLTNFVLQSEDIQKNLQAWALRLHQDLKEAKKEGWI